MPSIRFDKDEVKQLAAGRWKEIFESLGVHFEVGKHGPCPRCGGKDRFRPFNDFAQTGGMICGAGGCDKSFSDGLEAVQWYTDCDFQEAVDKVGQIVGAKPKGKKKKQPIDRLQLDSEINELLLPYYLIHNEAINQTGLERMQAMTGQFDDQVVMALPAWQTLDGKPTNWVVMSAMTKKIWHRENNRDVQVRKKTLGKGWGLMGAVAEMAAADVIWKCEGPTDCAAFLSHRLGVAVTNIHGASESPGPMVGLFAGKQVNICHDGDEAGQKGAAKWVEALREVGCSVRNVVLPEGYDLRGFLLEHDGLELLELANQAELLRPGAQVDETAGENGAQPGQGSKAREPIDDYAYDRRLVPDDCIELLTRLQLEIVCQDDEGQVTIYSRATGMVRTIKYIERLQLANLLMFGGMPCYHQITEANDDEDVNKFKIREVRRAIGIAASAKQLAGKVELRDHGIYATGNDIVLCNGKHLSLYKDGQWVKTNRPFYRDLIFSFSGEAKDWYDHDHLGALVERAKDPAWCAYWISKIESYIDRWTFANPKTDPLLMTGLIISSFVQQSWSWRPQVSIRGQSGCGKSMLFQLLFGGEAEIGLFNGAALKVSGSSAAGIRQKIRTSSVVLGIDEFDQVKKPQEILNLIRTAGRGEKLIMGSAHHRHIEFGLTNICWLAGIFISLDSEADQNRFIEFDMLQAVEPKRSAFEMPTREQVQEAQLPLLAIAIANGTKAAATARTAYMRAKGSEKALNDRIVENMSVPSAMLAVSTGGDVDDAVRFIELFAVPARRAVEVTSTHDDMLVELLQATIDVGSGSKMNVAEVINGDQTSVHVVQVEKQIGVGRKMSESGDWWLVIYPKSAAKQIHKGAQDRMPINPSGLRQILSRIDGAVLNRAYLAGIQQRCVWIPWDRISKLIDSDERF